MSQETTAPAGAVVAPPPKSRRGFFLKLLVLVVVLAIIGWVIWYFVDGRWYEDTDDAYVNGNVVQITPQIAGTVTSIGA
ncbi:MAG: EmrA/EmrK family multidrug efflux transporter periplasmic adaptor subunit, partial [Luteibacter sp.]